MKLAFLFVGADKEPWLNELSETYEKKLKPFVKTEIIRLKPTKLGRGASDKKLDEESASILKAIGKDDIVVLCDERGEMLDSRKFSGKLVKLFERGRPRVVFVIGGAFGFNEELRARADWTWSFSKLVFNHHIAQAVVLEQVYRAFTIWKNLPYHND
ncbi:MAG TPA: 23S rRNA (pseudouridine(1915)-N(3))-methyltransferase RlmH [Bdellovibrionales bacterium]|nr:23S rRNA (pseudouridine(1915)-N(3))-methyltransferase RlmH [Bdellovibrionales bacterium]